MTTGRMHSLRGLSMAEFRARYGTETQCENALARARWPDGFRCPKCNGSKHCVFERESRGYWECGNCRQQVTVTSGTIFQATKLPLTQWFLAMHLLTTAKSNLSALALMRHLGVSYRTAWTVKHKLLQVMDLREETRVLSGQVELLQTTLKHCRRRGERRGAGPGTALLVAVQTDGAGRPEQVRIVPRSESAGTGRNPVKRTVQGAVPVPAATAGHGFHGSKSPDLSVSCVVRTPRRCAPPLFGQFATAIYDSYHAGNLSKYGRRYLAEAQYRFNRRTNLEAMIGELIRDAISTRPHKEFLLRAAC